MIKTHAAPHLTPPSVRGGDDSQPSAKTPFEQTMYQRNLFVVLALNMTWRLAIVVIVPIVGGYKLDQHFHTSPILTIVGLLITIAGVILVLRGIVAQSQRRVEKLQKDGKR